MVEAGYWPESQALLRRTGECCAVVRAIAANGGIARDWLADPPRYKATNAVPKYVSREFHGTLDLTVHPHADWLPFIVHGSDVEIGPSQPNAFVPMILAHASVDVLALVTAVARRRPHRATAIATGIDAVRRDLDALSL